MRSSTDMNTIAQSRLTELDSIDSDVPAFVQHDLQSGYQTLQDDLAELPQAYAAYLDHQQSYWS